MVSKYQNSANALQNIGGSGSGVSPTVIKSNNPKGMLPTSSNFVHQTQSNWTEITNAQLAATSQ